MGPVQGLQSGKASSSELLMHEVRMYIPSDVRFFLPSMLPSL